ncbi:MAG TPA: hypothetical protein VNZ52_14420 [Candidatus Thermoplasmatota archaeon]|nr:hypothetical protein [Candidatus Thermoplasmatota archaeon]
MKIDIGNGKILGTKRVSQNGQISGFTEYAGREVLVVLPEGEPTVKLDAKEYVRELQVATNEQMKVAFEQYKELKKKFDTPDRATKEFMTKHAPKNFQGLYEKVDSWVKEQVGKAETKIEARLDRRPGTRENGATGDSTEAPKSA